MVTDAPRGSRVKLASLLTPPLLAVALFVAWAQPWVVLTLDDGVRIAAMGDRAAAVLPAIAVASFALTSALALASRRVRPVLGALLALLGALAVAVSVRVMVEPISAGASSVTELTAVEGERSIRALVDSAALTGWPVAAAVVGGALALVGVVIGVTSARWPRPVRTFDRPDDSESGDDWDALSDGRDPTAR